MTLPCHALPFALGGANVDNLLLLDLGPQPSCELAQCIFGSDGTGFALARISKLALAKSVENSAECLKSNASLCRNL